MNVFRKRTIGPETKHRYKVHDDEGNPHTITISVREDRVYRGYYMGGWRHICNEEPMPTREYAAKQTLDFVESFYKKEWLEYD